MWNYNYSDELYHYGVKGMKWGVRRASKLQNKARIARDSAREWDEMAGYASAKGKTKRAAKYKENAAKDRLDVAKYQNKVNRMAEKRYTKAGKKAGAADYEREKGNKAYEAHDKNAKALESMAKKYDSAGQVAKAELARRSASALRARGENIRAAQYKTADAYMKRSDKLNKKASDFTKEANVSMGKKKVDEILKSSRQAGYNTAKRIDEYNKESQIHDALGDTGYNAYNYIRGRG